MKTKRLNGLQSFLLVAIGCLVGSLGFAGLAAAAAPFSDDFDSYTTGNLSGQGDWTGYSSNPQIETSVVDTLPNAVSQDGMSEYKTGSAVASGQWFFSVYYTAGAYVDRPAICIGGSWYSSVECLQIDKNGTYISNLYSATVSQNLISGWNRMGIEWSAGTGMVRLYLNGTWSGWGNPSQGAMVPITAMLVNFSSSYGGWYFDSLSGDETTIPPTIAGYDPILTPTTPVNGTSTLVDFDNFQIAGTLQIPSANTWIWDDLNVKFYKVNSLIASRVYSFSLGDLAAGQSISYNGTTSIPILAAGNNFFKVQYSMTGHKFAGSIANNPTIDWPLLQWTDTWVTDNATSTTPPASQIILSTLPQQEAQEDCGAYANPLDIMVCNLKNFITGAFLPSNDAINQINQTMAALKTKFPMNYTTAITETFSTIAAGVDDNRGFSLTLYGNTAAVNTAIFSQDLGGGVTLGGAIKLILTFLAFGAFLFWGINYMHRIL